MTWKLPLFVSEGNWLPTGPKCKKKAKGKPNGCDQLFRLPQPAPTAWKKLAPLPRRVGTIWWMSETRRSTPNAIWVVVDDLCNETLPLWLP